MNRLFEVVFSVGNDSNLQWISTQVQSLHPQTAQAMVEAQYGRECHVYSVRQID